MSKWKCEICGNNFDNFHAQGFDNKIYCPLCYFKKLCADLQVENETLKKQLANNGIVSTCENCEWFGVCPHSYREFDYKNECEKLENQQQEFIKYLEEEIKDLEHSRYVSFNKFGEYKLMFYKDILQKYKEIIGVSNE